MKKQHLVDTPHLADNYKSDRTPGNRTRVGYICEVHGYIRGNHCPQCVKQDIHTFAVKDENKWVRGWWEHIDAEPIYIENKQHLISECKKRNLMPKALIKRRSQGKGWTIKK